MENLINSINYSYWGAILFLIIFTIRPFTFLGASILLATGGIIFGPILGTILGFIGWNISLIAVYFAGKLIPDFTKKIKNKKLKNWKIKLIKNPFYATLLSRILYLPHDSISALAGFLKINFFKFVLANLIGTIIPTLFWVLGLQSLFN